MTLFGFFAPVEVEVEVYEQSIWCLHLIVSWWGWGWGCLSSFFLLVCMFEGVGVCLEPAPLLKMCT